MRTNEPFDWAALDAELATLRQAAADAAALLGTLGNPAPGGSPRSLLAHYGKARLFRYQPLPGTAVRIPLLIVYALVNRPSMADLEPGRSLIRELLAEGIDVHLVEWEDPGALDAGRGLDDYITADLHACVGHLERGTGPVNLLGICQGGTFALCYAALEPARVRSLVTTVTPVDFQTPDDALSRLLRDVDLERLGSGNLDGDALNLLFLRLKPYRLLLQKYAELGAQVDNPAALATFLRMERWIFDSPDLAGRALQEFASWFYRENRLVTGGLQLAGREVSLANIRTPLLNLYAREDHLVPPAASKALGRLVGSKDYTALELPGGHIGLYVGGQARRLVATTVAAWLEKRNQRARVGRKGTKSPPEDQPCGRSTGAEGRSNVTQQRERKNR